MQTPGSVNVELEQIHYNLPNTKGYLIPTVLFCRHTFPYKLTPPSTLTLYLLVQTSVSKLYLYKTIETIRK